VLRRPLQFLLLLFLPALLPAQEPALLPDDAAAALEAVVSGKTGTDQIAKLLPHLGVTGVREKIREALAKQSEFPRMTFVVLLSNRELAIRMGALEFLEEAAGGDFGYTPWADPGSDEVIAAVQRWRQWAGESGPVARSARLSEDQRQAALREILAGDPDKSSRARRMLETDGLAALEFLETHLANTPALPEAARVRIRAAEYQIVLARRFGPQAEMLARDLTTGSRDQLLSALTAIRDAGLECLPVLRDFLTHSDPLVRETALDSWLLTGRGGAVQTAAPLLESEKDVNVIHGALRRLKDLPGSGSLALATALLNHPDEDLLVSALQTCQSLSGGNRRSYSTDDQRKVTAPLQTAVLKLLEDPRWRVRTAALEFVTAMKMSAAEAPVLRLLEDSDNFVRFAAVKAAGALSLHKALPQLRRLFLADAAMIGPVIEGFGALSKDLDGEMTQHLNAAPVDVRIGALRAMETYSSSFDGPILAMVQDRDPDVSCTALRIIASSEMRYRDSAAGKALVEVMEKGDAARRTAVYEALVLPRNEVLQPLGLPTAQGPPTTLDPLYDAFLHPLAAATKETGGGPPVTHPVVAAAIREAQQEDSPHAWSAAEVLAERGWPQAWGPLLKMLPKLTTAQKADAVDVYYTPSGPDSVRFFQALLTDPVQEVREAAAATLFNEGEKQPAFVSLVLPYLSGELPISPAAVLDYNTRDSVSRAKAAVQPWAMTQLQNPAAPEPRRIFAMLLLEIAPHAPAAPVLTELARRSPSVWMRRAAWHALAAQEGGITAHLDAIARDPEAAVRLVIPDAWSGSQSAWVYHFDAAKSTRRPWYDGTTARATAPEAALQVLQALAARDPSEAVRFEAMFALLIQQQPVNLDPFLSLLARQPKESSARQRMTRWLDEAGAGPGLRPLLAMVDHEALTTENYAALIRRMDSGSSGFQTFSDLAKTAAAITTLPQHTAAASGAAAARTSLPVIYFHKPGCEECRRASSLLESMKSSFPGLAVREYNIMEAEGTVMNQALCQRFGVPPGQHTLTPAIFTQAGYSIRNDIAPATVGALFSRTLHQPQDDAWMTVSREESAAAAQEVERRYESLTLGVVIIAGLLDGVNPCAFATIIFFLSWLQIAKRTPREMLLTGAAFILAVFLAYLSAGLVLFKVLEGLSRFAWIQKSMNYVFAAFALVVAMLSFRDAWRAGKGRMDEMTLQLPAFLKNRIRSAIRTGAKARRFIIAAFVTGLIVSLLELACTGQVYAPIVYQIQQGRGGAVLWLVLYNVAFILPLAVIFLATWLGLRSEHLIAFQKKHTRTVKFALGVLFTGLALLILFQDRLLH